ncbi:hypothetical protein LCGC14_1486740 [marine sediment metagenome]|uniref:Uncharacterized protein n=1 Tax=marine sediment metagenome TaxID=412755 RepID=A0A0F9M9U6_9ZZZZ
MAMEMIRIRPPKKIIALAVIFTTMNIVGLIGLIIGIIVLLISNFNSNALIPLAFWVVFIIGYFGLENIVKREQI